MSLLEKKEYFARFHMYVGQDMNHLQAFRKVQEDLEKEFGKIEHKGYSSYHSFKNALHKWFKGEN